jgi:hypothetical protein
MDSDDPNVGSWKQGNILSWSINAGNFKTSCMTISFSRLMLPSELISSYFYLFCTIMNILFLLQQ